MLKKFAYGGLFTLVCLIAITSCQKPIFETKRAQVTNKIYICTGGNCNDDAPKDIKLCDKANIKECNEQPGKN